MTKTALITGGGRGIGRGCALELAARGVDVVLVDLIAEDLETTKGEIEALGRRALVFEADVAEHRLAGEIVSRVINEWGRIDILFNNAGKSNAKSILEITENEFDRTIAINLKGAFNYIHAAAPHMKQAGGGRIIIMSSLNAHTGGVTSAVSHFSYTAAKAGLLGMTRALAKELAPDILVNAICPGVIKTERSNDMIRAREAELVRGIAAGRVGTPADVAQVVAFLALSEPCFLTGQDIKIDGFQWVT
ncbi:SDR family NAD(P)-dependent oxidoreductase [Chelativorans sp. AA-79]|uniref:SDR family NAD(P)-dependent oxidoreductase n=1 Tax=Chelativorans sp. AA-79 TaxID=3028735 RepID=UPI0023F67A59|nr:SDR family NAD(P)-dependent oxidoreductase [Chelativorans sp. AA-79]WEX09141.1 SDR family NAD(P)-dependent oxidoreductase [Chelativorans sp. AA-79]